MAEALVKEGIAFEKLDGLCSLNQRDKSLGMMRQEPKIRVLLATIGAGGVGIDLTCAQKVYLMVSFSVWICPAHETDAHRNNKGALLESQCRKSSYRSRTLSWARLHHSCHTLLHRG